MIYSAANTERSFKHVVDWSNECMLIRVIRNTLQCAWQYAILCTWQNNILVKQIDALETVLLDLFVSFFNSFFPKRCHRQLFSEASNRRRLLAPVLFAIGLWHQPTLLPLPASCWGYGLPLLPLQRIWIKLHKLICLHANWTSSALHRSTAGQSFPSTRIFCNATQRR